jgi:hypothetical protein
MTALINDGIEFDEEFHQKTEERKLSMDECISRIKMIRPQKVCNLQDAFMS